MALAPFIAYPGQIAVGDPGYPLGRARNEAVENDGTGTPFEEQIVNDIFGFQQSLLVASGIEPTGVPDAVGASQYLAALEQVVDIRFGRMALANRQLRSPAAGTEPYAINGAAYNTVNARYVAVGATARIQTSQTGASWAAATAGSSSTQNLNGVAASISTNGYVAVGDSGEIQTSTIGTGTWTRRTPGAGYTGNFQSVANGLGGAAWVAVGANGEIQSATAALNDWTRRSAGSGYAGTYYSVAWCQFTDVGRFVAVGFGGRIVYSLDGQTWSVATPDSSFSGTFTSVHFGNEVAIASGTDSEIQWSRNGLSWNHVSPPAGPVGVGYVGGTYDPLTKLHVLTGIDPVAVSRDGESWVALKSPQYTDGALMRVASSTVRPAIFFGGAGFISQSLAMP